MRRLIECQCAMLLLLFIVSGCASGPGKETIANIEQYFVDNEFAEVSVEVTPDELFALPPQVEVDLRQEYKRSRMARDYIAANLWLANYINADNGGFKYQDNLTKTPMDTFNARAGNCLSLVLLSASLADALGVDVEFQEVDVPPVWDKAGDFYLVNGHINLRLIPRESSETFLADKNALQIDFLPERSMRGYAKRRIDRTTVMAMFYNNVAAESLVEGKYDLSYAYLKQSLQLKADFIPALNTLAILYRYKGLDEKAEVLYKLALSQNSEDMNALFNYGVLLASQNRLEEWAEVHKTLELVRIRNPYYYYDMAQQAYSDHEYQTALTWYKRAVEKADYRHEFYFGLSRAYWAMGDERRAKLNMQKALSLSVDEYNQKRYQAKLQAMQSHLGMH
ncbi:tetratricopeptide repeat protein [Shewanella marisflavi]|uniref:tetratricopeptide repeat protein n=1 Tax=Shewanella marisflavi TaxID=260364 RepID=UPI003AB0EE84